jgi:hypothetical protein
MYLKSSSCHVADFFQRENVQPHMSAHIATEIHHSGFSLLDHPSHTTQHLAPTDFHLFLKLKKHLTEQHILSDDEVKTVMKMRFYQQNTYLL